MSYRQVNVDFALSKASEAVHAEDYRLKLASVTMGYSSDMQRNRSFN